MGIVINTNTASLNIQNSLSKVQNLLAASFRRLSTGLRIATAADDAAGLAISERLRAQIRSLDQAKRNANDGISLAQTGEGALDEVNNILVRLRELSIQASNGTVSGEDRDTLQEEFSSLRDEIDRIAQSTGFNGIQLLDGSQASVTFHVGSGTSAAANQISVNLDPTLATSLSIDSLDIGSTGDPSAAITAIDSAINTVSSLRGRQTSRWYQPWAAYLREPGSLAQAVRVNRARRKSRFIRAMNSIEMPFGQTASHSLKLVQAPKYFSMVSTIFCTR